MARRERGDESRADWYEGGLTKEDVDAMREDFEALHPPEPDYDPAADPFRQNPYTLCALGYSPCEEHFAAWDARMDKALNETGIHPISGEEAA